jgi:hypothetical protein
VSENEIAIRSYLDCKIISFDNLEEIDRQIKKSQDSLNQLRNSRKKLESFLSDRFVVSDFFSES